MLVLCRVFAVTWKLTNNVNLIIIMDIVSAFEEFKSIWSRSCLSEDSKAFWVKCCPIGRSSSAHNNNESDTITQTP